MLPNGSSIKDIIAILFPYELVKIIRNWQLVIKYSTNDEDLDKKNSYLSPRPRSVPDWRTCDSSATFSWDACGRPHLHRGRSVASHLQFLKLNKLFSVKILKTITLFHFYGALSLFLLITTPSSNPSDNPRIPNFNFHILYSYWDFFLYFILALLRSLSMRFRISLTSLAFMKNCLTERRLSILK